MAVKAAPHAAQDVRTAAKRPAREARAEAESGSGWYAFLARAGLVAKGISFSGRWLVGIAGIARKFEDKWRLGTMSESERSWGGRAGVVGHAARFVVFGLIGVFVAKAAVDYNPKDAIGLDGALQKLSEASYGPLLLGLTAFGLVWYGIYCLVDARYRDVSADQQEAGDVPGSSRKQQLSTVTR